jgi:hypothetical protein
MFVDKYKYLVVTGKRLDILEKKNSGVRKPGSLYCYAQRLFVTELSKKQLARMVSGFNFQGYWVYLAFQLLISCNETRLLTVAVVWLQNIACGNSQNRGACDL